LIITHGDKDHAGGMQSVLQALPVGVLRSSLGEVVPQATAPDAQACLAGTRWHWDGIDFEMLHPAAMHYTREKQRSNDRSCVLRIGVGGQFILLTADIEQKTERELLQSVGEKLASHVLLAPHHGSRTSSSPEFVAKVAPQIVLVAAGYRNRFGHPKDDVLARYRDAGSRIYRTDLDGALILTAQAKGLIEVRRQRAFERRYWHAALENPDLAEDED
jgi:competence protein ComEC